RIPAVAHAWGAAQVDAAGTVLGDAAERQDASLSPQADGELPGMVALAEQPVDADLADIEPVAVELRPDEAGLDAARAIAVIDAEIDVEVFRRREVDGHAVARIIEAAHSTDHRGVHEDRGEEQGSHGRNVLVRIGKRHGP